MAVAVKDGQRYYFKDVKISSGQFTVIHGEYQLPYVTDIVHGSQPAFSQSPHGRRVISQRILILHLPSQTGNSCTVPLVRRNKRGACNLATVAVREGASAPAFCDTRPSSVSHTKLIPLVTEAYRCSFTVSAPHSERPVGRRLISSDFLRVFYGPARRKRVGFSPTDPTGGSGVDGTTTGRLSTERRCRKRSS